MHLCSSQWKWRHFFCTLPLGLCKMTTNSLQKVTNDLVDSSRLSRLGRFPASSRVESCHPLLVLVGNIWSNWWFSLNFYQNSKSLLLEQVYLLAAYPPPHGRSITTLHYTASGTNQFPDRLVSPTTQLLIASTMNLRSHSIPNRAAPHSLASNHHCSRQINHCILIQHDMRSMTRYVICASLYW